MRSGELLGQIPLIGAGDAVFQSDARLPSERVQPRNIQQLARRPVRLGGVEHQSPSKPVTRCDHLGQLADGDILSGADVDDLRVVVSTA